MNSARSGLIFPAGSYSSTAETEWYDENFEQHTGIRTVTFNEETEVNAAELCYNIQTGNWSTYSPNTTSTTTTTMPTFGNVKFYHNGYGFTSSMQAHTQFGNATTPYYRDFVQIFAKPGTRNSNYDKGVNFSVDLNIDKYLDAGYNWDEIPSTWRVAVRLGGAVNKGTWNGSINQFDSGSSYKISDDRRVTTPQIDFCDKDDNVLFTAGATNIGSQSSNYYPVTFDIPIEYQNHHWQKGDHIRMYLRSYTTYTTSNTECSSSLNVTFGPSSGTWPTTLTNPAEYRKVGISRFPRGGGSSISLERDYENVWDLGYIETSTTEANVAAAYHSTLPTSQTTTEE